MAEQTAVLDATPYLNDETLRGWLERRRWYASKSRRVTSIEAVETVMLGVDPPLALLLVQAGFAGGAHDLYQLPVTIRPVDDGEAPIASADGWGLHDALTDPRQAAKLLELVETGQSFQTDDGCLRFHGPGVTAAGAQTPAGARPVGVEQSNTSIVFGDRLVMKAFRRIEPGINPELELLAFLGSHGFQHIAPLHGWYEYDGASLAVTLGVVQEFVNGAVDGWEMALDRIASDPDGLIAALGALGTVTGQMHSVLGSDSTDPAFAPEEPSEEAMSLLTATVDEDIERVFLRLPQLESLTPIAGHGEDVRELLGARSKLGVGGRVIRTHGDYHLGQTLLAPRGWVVIDFEGEPSRSLAERRQKRSPLRDVASMLRSFAYACSAAAIHHGRSAPAGFEERAREAFLTHYFDAVDSTLLPPGAAAVQNMLFVYELEKAVYELRYELDNRPDSIPAAGIRRLLESE